jgi:RNA polymerase sigma factor (sigma-70 family)
MSVQTEAVQGRYAFNSDELYVQLYKREFIHLTAVAYEYVSSWEIARDIVSDVFANFWEKRHTLRIWSLGGCKAYLLTSTRNTAFNALDAWQRHSRIHEGIWFSLDDRSESVHDEMSRNEWLREFRQAVQQLPTQCRRVVRLYLEGYTHQEIAETMRLSKRTIINQFMRGKSLIKEKIPLEGGSALSSAFID